MSKTPDWHAAAVVFLLNVFGLLLYSNLQDTKEDDEGQMEWIRSLNMLTCHLLNLDSKAGCTESSHGGGSRL